MNRRRRTQILFVLGGILGAALGVRAQPDGTAAINPMTSEPYTQEEAQSIATLRESLEARQDGHHAALRLVPDTQEYREREKAIPRHEADRRALATGNASTKEIERFYGFLQADAEAREALGQHVSEDMPSVDPYYVERYEEIAETARADLQGMIPERKATANGPAHASSPR